jgi:G3E family GTPase
VRRAALDLFLGMLRASLGARLLRLKGLIGIAEQPDRPVVIHGVQHVLHVPAVLQAWPDADRRSRVVLIGENLDRKAITRMWSIFTDVPHIDTHDAAVMSDNPLAPPTLTA